MKEQMVNVGPIPHDVYLKIRVLAAKNETTIKNYVAKVLRDHCEKECDK